jgi:hypothetical protein
MFVGVSQAVNGNNQIGALVLAFFESAAHEQGIVWAGLDAQSAEHAPLQLDVEDLQTVFIPLKRGRFTGRGNDLDDSQRAIFGARRAAGTPFFVPGEFLTPESWVLRDSLFRIRDGKRLTQQVCQGYHQPFGHFQSVHSIASRWFTQPPAYFGLLSAPRFNPKRTTVLTNSDPGEL